MRNMGKELEEHEEGHKPKNTPRFIPSKAQNPQNSKTSAHESIHGNWFQKFICKYDELAMEMNRYCTSNKHTQMDD